MNSPDPASLQNLNDIVLPDAIGWWPLANGWYFVIAMALIILFWLCYRLFRRWFGNRYRRAALQEFQLLERSIQNPADRDANLRQIPILIKRTALAVCPRARVASLSGRDWHQFLNSMVKNPPFTARIAATLDRVSYSAGDLNEVDTQAAAALLKATHHWLKHHQAVTGPEGGKES